MQSLREKIKLTLDQNLKSRDEIAIDDIDLKVNGPVSTTQNGDWDLSATWESGSVPASTDDVIIAHNNDVDDTRSCNSLTISAGGRLDVQAALTVASIIAFLRKTLS